MQQNHDDVDVNYANDKGRIIIICAYLLFYCIKWWKYEEQYSVGGKVALLFFLHSYSLVDNKQQCHRQQNKTKQNRQQWQPPQPHK
jgi:hypothetical protein